MRRGRRRTAGRHAPHRSPHRRCRSSCRRNRRTASRRPHAAAASSATTGLPRPDRVRRTSCGRNRRDTRRDIPPRPVAASRPCGATRGGSPASPAATANPWPWASGPDRGGSPMRRRQDRPAAANRRRLRAPGAGTLRRRSGQSRDWRQSGAWTGRRPTAAARRGSCAWVISVGPSPLLSKKERSPADSRITQRRSSRPSTALLPWSPSTGYGGRLQPETPVAMARSAQAVIEKVTGHTLGAFVTERIAKPLLIQSFVFNAPENIRSRFVQVTRPAQVTGALGTGYVPVVGPEAVPFPATKGTANLDPNRAFSPTAYNSGGAGMSGTVGDYARFLQMLLNEGELNGVRVLGADTVRQMTQSATGNMPTLRGPGWGFTLGFGILIDPAAAKSRLPAGSYGWGGIYGTQFWIDPTNRVVGLVMTQTAIIGSGAISNPIREAFYTMD